MKKGNYDLAVEVLQVYHDECCKSNTNKGRKSDLCNCDPLIKIVETDNSVEDNFALDGKGAPQLTKARKKIKEEK